MAAKKGTMACQSGQTALAARLLGRFAGEAAADGSNLIFSPLSIHVALALMSTGASGATLDEILAVAGAPSRDELHAFVRATVIDCVLADRSSDGGPVVAFACGAWTDWRKPLKTEYRDTIVGTFKGSATTVDFLEEPVESRKQINAWVAEVTKGLITELVNPEEQSKETTNVVVNAIYFKGKWHDPFMKENTTDHEFHRLDGSTVSVAFMQSWSYQQIACHDGFKVLKLPYRMTDVDWSLPDFDSKKLRSIPKFSMCIFLPDANDGLGNLTEMMSSSPKFLHNHLPWASVPVNEFRLPRFKLAYGGSIAKDLTSLGLILPFQPFTGGVTEITEVDATDDPIYVSDVIHKAVVDVNEEGCEAAAATESDEDMGFSLDFDEPQVVDFVADHPFAFFIIEETSGSIVFAGHVLDPSRE
ncbi:putative serpin-Z8 [Dichanthelium oligosanthes]|uniref:Putative serpin-Z8 n=1 Tax=Dichanthelium oligosanthes TaxID=888268 RepID=A0A1E5V781_9POAL|nr:putative serpin-Z8 [Dichanthelium oligosanthes]